MNTPINERVREVFEEFPLLISFSLDRQLCLCDIEVDSWPGCPWNASVYCDIEGMLADVIGEIIDDGAAEELRARTFARSLH
ncbi:MAG TPA: hypothetical protein VIV54_03920 [Burkholderiales bacterium]